MKSDAVIEIVCVRDGGGILLQHPETSGAQKIETTARAAGNAILLNKKPNRFRLGLIQDIIIERIIFL